MIADKWFALNAIVLITVIITVTMLPTFFNKHRQEIDSYLQPVTQQLNIVLDALHNLDTLQEHITGQGESVKNQIDTLVAQLVQAVQQSGARLKQDVDTLVQHKVTEMLRRKEEGEKLVAEVKSYKQHIQDKLCNGTQQEILLEKNDMVERLMAVNQELQVQEIQLKEIGDIAFMESSDVLGEMWPNRKGQWCSCS